MKLTDIDVQTPAQQFISDELVNAASLAERCGHRWRFQAADVRVGAGCDRIAVADRSMASLVGDCSDVLISRPIWDPEAWLDVVDGLNVFYVTIDHYVHLERLASVEWPTTPRVFIELAVGPGRFGGRPGRDAVDLANVVAAHDGVEFAGLSAEVKSLGMAESLLQTRDQITAAGIACEAVSVVCPNELGPQLPAGFEIRNDGGSHAGYLARVISRPSLELAAIDIGPESTLAAKDDLQIEVVGKQICSTVRVRHIDLARTLIVLPEDAQDLVIGDLVSLPKVRCASALAQPPVAVGSERCPST